MKNVANLEPDLSDYKKIALEKEKFQKILENKVRELDRSNKELEEFAYVASHDLQEPLRKITSFSERLKEKLPADLDPDIHFYLTRMLAATASMRVLIDNLLDFSRISRISEPFTTTDLNEVLSHVKADLELTIEETGTEIICDKLPTVQAIPSQMRQLFNNLINNAIKFRQPDKPSVISINTSLLPDNERENFNLKNYGTVFQITVSDQGIGFEQQYAERIFQIFQRLHGKAEFPGSGIGLSICKKIVESHNGCIYATGSPMEGASFVILIPETQT